LILELGGQLLEVRSRHHLQLQRFSKCEQLAATGAQNDRARLWGAVVVEHRRGIALGFASRARLRWRAERVI
jgi:hypothetical protein